MTTLPTSLSDSADAGRRYSIEGVCEALGVPPRDRRLFARWAAGPLTPKGLEELCAYVDVMIADRCGRPTDDLITELIALQIGGEELTVDDIHIYVATLVVGADPAPAD